MKQVQKYTIKPKSGPLVQPKLAINSPGDRYEQEADAMAERVVSGGVSRGSGGDAMRGSGGGAMLAAGGGAMRGSGGDAMRAAGGGAMRGSGGGAMRASGGMIAGSIQRK